MFKEIEKFIKKSLSPLPFVLAQNSTLTRRFKKIIRGLRCSYTDDSEPLKGRMQEISSRSKTLIEKILCIKDKVESQVERELFGHIAQVVEPMIREIQKIHIGALVAGDMAARYGMWENKAKIWLALEHSMHDRTEVIKAVTQLHFVGMKESIDQDLKVIANYQSQMISQLAISAKQQQELLLDVENSVSMYTEALCLLKESAPPLELCHIEIWKAHIDERRNQLFENALQQVDTLVESFPIRK